MSNVNMANTNSIPTMVNSIPIAQSNTTKVDEHPHPNIEDT
jgi:hypothetical protein